MSLTKVHNRMVSGAAVNVKDFGAVGDGVTDDTAAIQAASDSLVLGGTLYFPRGTYIISSQINMYNATASVTELPVTNIIGEGYSTVIEYTGSGKAFVWDLASATATRLVNAILRDFWLKNTGSGTHGIWMSGVNYANINDVRIDNFTTVQFYTEALSGNAGGLWSNATNLHCTGGLRGIETSAANAWVFIKPRCFSNTDYGMYINSASTTIISYSGVPNAASSAYVGIRTAGSTNIFGFEFENGGATISPYLIEVADGWTRALGVSTRSVSSDLVIGKTGTGRFLLDPTLLSNDITYPNEMLSINSIPVIDQLFDTGEAAYFAPSGATQARLSVKPNRIKTVSPTVGVNGVYAAYQNLWTTAEYSGSTLLSSPDIRGFKFVLSGAASTLDVIIVVLDGTTIAGSNASNSVTLTLSNGTTFMTYEDVMSLLSVDVAIQRVQIRPRVPEASFTGSFDATMIYKFD